MTKEQGVDEDVAPGGTPGTFDLVVRGERVVTPAGERPCEVGVRDGVIVAVEPLGAGLRAATPDREITLRADQVLLPGLVDTHVHVNEPGRTEWEGFASATRAAARGGVTTILDMPLNSIPPTVDVEALEIKRKTARGQVFVDVGFWGGAVPGNADQLRPMHDAGVFGFKCFLLHSGVEEFPPIGADELEADLAVLADAGAMMIVHAEDSHAIDRAPHAHGDHYDAFLASRPRGAENVAIAQVIERARWTGARVHVLHLSSSDALPMLRSAKREGVRVTVETCPHYLALAAEEVPDGATQFKCCPPIREAENREALWEGLLDGTIDHIATDHSPSTPDLKAFESGDFGAAWGGVASLQLGLAVVWTQARRRGVPLTRVVDWMATRPAAWAGLPRKGAVRVGNDADLAVFEPDAAFVVDPHRLEHKNPITPYADSTLSGVVTTTILRGAEVDLDRPTGRLLTRGER